MGIYIVRPKSLSAARTVALISRRLGAEARAQQIEEVFSCRMKDPVDQKIRKWIDDAPQTEVTRVSKAEAGTRITGTTILDMSADEAERMRREVPEAVVLQDRPIELIRPRRTAVIEELFSTCKDLRQPEDRQGKGLGQAKAAL